jgi:hypothetical protein
MLRRPRNSRRCALPPTVLNRLQPNCRAGPARHPLIRAELIRRRTYRRARVKLEGHRQLGTRLRREPRADTQARRFRDARGEAGIEFIWRIAQVTIKPLSQLIRHLAWDDGEGPHAGMVIRRIGAISSGKRGGKDSSSVRIYPTVLIEALTARSVTPIAGERCPPVRDLRRAFRTS